MKAIILLSGGLDSTVVLALAIEQGRECVCLSFDYGQRHKIELERARAIAARYHCHHRIVIIDPATFSNTSLVDQKAVPKGRTLEEMRTQGIPSTYVPGRNTLFLAYAAGQAEIYDAAEIWTGPNLLDHNPYPDCRPEFYAAFQGLLNLATKQAVEGAPPLIRTPLIEWDKTRIVQEAKRLGVPIELTWSCYAPQEDLTPCGACDACKIRLAALEVS